MPILHSIKYFKNYSIQKKKQLTKHLNITLIPNGFKTKFEMQTDFPDCQPVTPVTKAFLSNCHVFQHMAVFIPSESSKD